MGIASHAVVEHRGNELRRAEATRRARDPARPGEVIRSRLSSVAPEVEVHGYGPNGAGDLIDGRFELIEPLGVGGMGTVWRARDFLLDVDVALKLVHRDQIARGLDRLLAEARALAAIRHPGVVKVHTFGKSGAQIYLAMELIEGETLEALLIHGGSLPVDDAVQLMVPVLDILEAAHEAGIVHRDVKPNNIMVVAEPDGTLLPKLLDFGVSLRETASKRLTLTGQVLGTPYYMAAEQAAGERHVDHRADLWSTAVVLYELIAGIGPFDGDDYHSVLSRVLLDDPRPLTDISEADEALWQIIERALRKKPAERFGSAREMADALRTWLAARGHRVDLLGRLLPVVEPAPVSAPIEVAPRGMMGGSADELPVVESSVWLEKPPRRPRRGLKRAGFLAAASVALIAGLWPALTRPRPVETVDRLVVPAVAVPVPTPLGEPQVVPRVATIEAADERGGEAPTEAVPDGEAVAR